MTIEINGTTVIDNNRNLLNTTSIQFQGGGTQTTLSASGIGSLLYDAKERIHAFQDPDIVQATNTDTFSEFANSISIYGNLMAVSARGEDRPFASNTPPVGQDDNGVVYIFDIEKKKLLNVIYNPDYSPASNQYFGANVKLYGKTLAVSTTSSLSSSGNVYLFDAETGSLLWAFGNPNSLGGTSSEYFGWDMDLYQNYLIVGTPNADAESTRYGTAHVFDVNTGIQIRTFLNPILDSNTVLGQFGDSVAICPPYAIIGAPEVDDSASIYKVGRAYLYNIFTGELVRTIDLPETLGRTLDFFGTEVAINETHYFVGSSRWTTNSSTSTTGRIYIFDIETGTLQRTIENPSSSLGQGGTGGDGFGDSFEVHGNKLVANCPNEEHPLYYTTSDVRYVADGVVYIYDWTNGDLLQVYYNPNDSGSSWDSFGKSVSIYGNHLVAGSDSGPNTTGTGGRIPHAHLFSLEKSYRVRGVRNITFDNGVTLDSQHMALQSAHSQGDLLKKIYNPNTEAITNDGFGNAVAIHGNFAIIGEQYGNDTTGSNQGQVHIYDLTKRKIVRTVLNPNTAPNQSSVSGDNFGSSVAISDDYFAVGALSEDTESQSQNGAVYVFDLHSGKLLNVFFEIDSLFDGVGNFFGYSIDLDGNYLLVGAPRADHQSTGTGEGAAYLYDVRSGELHYRFEKVSTVDIDEYTVDGGDSFGQAVALSGNYAIIGAPTDGGGVEGMVYIFQAVTTDARPGQAYHSTYPADWVHTSPLLLNVIKNPDIALGGSQASTDSFGEYIAADGQYLVVGVPHEDDNDSAISGNDEGKVYVYNLASGELVWSITHPELDEKGNVDLGTARHGDQFGWGVDICGDYIVAAALNTDEYSETAVGEVFMIDVNTGKVIRTFRNPGSGANDLFGANSVAIGENYIMIGNSSGDVRVRNGTTYTNVGAAYQYAARDMTYLDKLTSLV